ncbi:MAG: hypothetical protein WB867_00690 [Candidatus Dormiibacterota bacterium]
MSGDCMAGMVMPGCASYAPSLRAGAGPSLIKPILIIVVVLAAISVAIFALRLLERRDITNYSVLNEFVGHVAPAIGLAGISLLTLGAMPTLGPLLVYTVAFGVLAAALVFRCIPRWTVVRNISELWVVILAIAMAYIFSAASIVPLTVLIIVLALAFVGDVILRANRNSQLSTVGSAGRRALATLGSNGEVALALAVVLLLAVSQWPGTFS